jgi:hypothetical protein
MRIALTAEGAGTQYMVVDCGGGTVDITVLETNRPEPGERKMDHDTFTVVYSGGNDMGSTRIDRAFEHYLGQVFGAATIDNVRVCGRSAAVPVWVPVAPTYACLADLAPPPSARRRGSCWTSWRSSKLRRCPPKVVRAAD